MVAVDDSPNSRQAVQDALSLGRSCATLQRITVLAVARREDGQTQTRGLVEAICEQGRQAGLTVPMEPLVVVGDAATSIVKTAQQRQVDMILVGGRGKSGLAKMLKGHVTELVIGKAPCAVLVVTA